MKLNNRSELGPQRKVLRAFSTSAEIALWLRLKGKQLDGRKFRRQHSVGPYILDFYCPAEKLAIELDGDHHFTEDRRKRYDESRSEYLKKLGVNVIRFENCEVFDHPEFVIKAIKTNFKETR